MPEEPEPDIQTAIADLRSNDAIVQNRGVAVLRMKGRPAARALLPLLEDPSPVLRAQVMYTLSQIADIESAPAFTRGLSDAEGRVRAYAAVGLARIQHESALAACIQTLNDGADELHADMTPAVETLGGMGLLAVPALLDRMGDTDESTRLHAQRALERIIDIRHGFQPGRGFPSNQASRAAADEWQANGGYDYRADATARTAALTAWRRWLERTKSNVSVDPRKR